MLRAIHLLIWGLVTLSCRAQDEENYQLMKNCDNAIVDVTYLQVLCDANRTYYYGSSVHRSSTTCDEDDKATIAFEFDVGDTEEDEISDIYFTMAVYTASMEMVYEQSSTSLCDFVEEDCVQQGSYSFTTQVQFTSADGGDSEFVPLVTMAFSAGTDGASDLGGTNLNECDTEEEQQSKIGTAGHVFMIVGIVVGVSAAIGAGILLSIKKQDTKTLDPVASSRERMNDSDYDIVIAESGNFSAPSYSIPFLPLEDPKDEDGSGSEATGTQESSTASSGGTEESDTVASGGNASKTTASSEADSDASSDSSAEASKASTVSSKEKSQASSAGADSSESSESSAGDTSASGASKSAETSQSKPLTVPQAAALAQPKELKRGSSLARFLKRKGLSKKK